MAIARDKFWMFGVRPHQDDIFLMPGLPGVKTEHFYKSRITPAEGAFMLDLPNMIMVVIDHEPAPFSKEAIGYMQSFCRMDKVLWGACRYGKYNENDLSFICEMASEYHNLEGVFIDDLSTHLKKIEDYEERVEYCNNMLKATKEKLREAGRPLETYITWYWHEDPIPGMLDYVDGFSFWTWNSDELPMLKDRFEACEKKYKGKKIFLGIYMYDFRNRKPVPDEYMELQCNYALELLKEGRIEGIIFEANSTMGVNLPSEHWLRAWIDKVKYTEIPDQKETVTHFDNTQNVDD